MDLAAAISYNGITAIPLTPTAGRSDVSGLTIKSVDFAPIPVSVQVEKAALRDGATISDAWLSGRPISIQGEAYGSTPGDAWDRVNTWMAAFSPRSPTLTGTDAFAFVQQTSVTATWGSGTIPLYVNASPVREPWHGAIVERDAAAGPHVVPVFAQLMATDPYKYVNAAQIVQSLGTAGVVLPYRGNAPTKEFTCKIMLSGTGPSSVDIWGNAPGIGYSLVHLNLSTLSPGVEYVLYWSQPRVINYLGAVVPGIIGSTSVFGTIVPGAGWSYAVYVGTAGNISWIRLTYPEAFF